MKRSKVGGARPDPAKLQKVIVPWEESGPQHEPLFVNHFQVLRSGTDVYIDAGIVPVDDVVTTGETGGQPRFFVLQRLVMSVNSFASLCRNMTETFEKLKEGGHILDEALQGDSV